MWVPNKGVNPLDPAHLNTAPMTPVQGKQVIDTLNALKKGTTQDLNPHPYNNFPDFTTGAILPPSAKGYTTFYVPGATWRERVVIDNATGNTFYTNSHYQSFYQVILPPGM